MNKINASYTDILFQKLDIIQVISASKLIIMLAIYKLKEMN